MIEKTKGIVLHQIKYTDSCIVVWIYTREYGRQSFLVRGIRSKKSGRQNVFFQPMFILDLVFYHKDSGRMQVMKEFSVSYSPSDFHSNIRKSSVAVFIGEVLASVLREETSNEELFNFIERSVIYFDRAREGYANFHIAFLAGLSSYLGFEPAPRINTTGRYFDMLNGMFTSVPPGHGMYANEEHSGILARFFSSSYEDINMIPLNGALRNEILDVLLKYYSVHLPGLKKIMSLRVLKEVFS